MAITSWDDIDLRQTIRFKTINPHDNVRWSGQLLSMCTYELAKAIADVDAYYQDVVRANSDTSFPAKENLTYLILSVDENNGASRKRVFASEFVDMSTLEIVNQNTYLDIRIYDIDRAKAQDILSYILACGYTAEIK